MDYIEKRKRGKERIFKKQIEDYNKYNRLMVIEERPIAITNEGIAKSMYKDLTLNEKKLYRYILSIISKEDDINSNFILNHKTIQELFNHHFTSKEIHDMLYHISISFNTQDKNGDYFHIPIFKYIKTSDNYKTTEIIFNEWFNGLIFFDSQDGHFLKYDLGQIMNYKNLYSPDLFELLLSITRSTKQEIVSIDFDIDKLKKQLNCETMRNNDFISRVIKKSIEDINANNKTTLGGTVDYKYNKTKKIITFYTENISYMLRLEKKGK